MYGTVPATCEPWFTQTLHHIQWHAQYRNLSDSDYAPSSVNAFSASLGLRRPGRVELSVTEGRRQWQSMMMMMITFTYY